MTHIPKRPAAATQKEPARKYNITSTRREQRCLSIHLWRRTTYAAAKHPPKLKNCGGKASTEAVTTKHLSDPKTSAYSG